MLKRQLAVVCSLIIAAGIVGQCFSATVYAQSQAATRAREVARATPAEVTVTLNEQFFNSLLDAVFTNLKAPTFPLALASTDQKKKTARGESSQASLKLPAFSPSHSSSRGQTEERTGELRRGSQVRTCIDGLLCLLLSRNSDPDCVASLHETFRVR